MLSSAAACVKSNLLLKDTGDYVGVNLSFFVLSPQFCKFLDSGILVFC